MPKTTQEKYSYQYGSEAKAYYNVLPRPNVEPSFRPEKKPSVLPRKKLDIVFGIKLSLCGMTLFACSFTYVHAYSELISKQQEIQTLKREIRETKSIVSSTQSKLSENLNLDYIRERASRELGMKEPAPHQIVYIEMPKQSYTLYEK